MRDHGVIWYVGRTQVGKTHAALERMRRLHAATGRPVIILDLARAKQFEDDYHTFTLAQVVKSVWGRGESVVYTPPSHKELDELCEAIQEAKGVILVVDEASRVLSGRGYCSKPLLGLIRTHAHANVWILLTTQHFSGDIPAEARECAEEVHCFACEGTTSLQLIEREYGVPQSLIISQSVGQSTELLATRRQMIQSLASAPKKLASQSRSDRKDSTDSLDGMESSDVPNHPQG